MNDNADKGRGFCLVVDGVQYSVGHPLITGGEIMDLAGIPREVGLILIAEDGTQRVVGEEERLNLAQLKGKFKRCPRFVRG